MLLLIDGNALLHRSFHAMPTTIKTSSGELTNAVFGFTNAMINLIDQWHPTHIACTFDTPERTFRHEQFEEYKGTRQAPPPGLYEQLPRVESILNALGIIHIASPGFESDDLIGTLTKKAEADNLPSIIVSSDNDFIQLISTLTSFLCTAKGLGKAELFTPDKVFEKHGLYPIQWLDYKTLRGDPSDNLPGIPGIGEKTAKQLLQKWNTLENLYQHMDELPANLRQKFSDHHEKATMTRALAAIHREVPMTVTISDLAYPGANNTIMCALCEELEFHKLSKRFNVPNTLF